MCIPPLVAAAVLQAPLSPLGDPEPVTWGKQVAYASQQGVSFQITGPTAVVMDLWGSARGKPVLVELIRDGAQVSRNTVRLKRTRGPAPKGHRLHAKLGFAAPAGVSTYLIKSEERLLVSATSAKKFPAGIAAAPEQPMEEVATVPPVPAPAAPGPPPAEEPAAAGVARPSPSTPAHRAVGVLPIEGEGVDTETTERVETAVLREIDEQPGLRGISSADIANALGSAAPPPDCRSDFACLARTASEARLHLVLDVKLAVVAGTLSLSVRLLDPQLRAEIGRAAEYLPDGDSERAAEIHRLIVQVLAPDKYIGALAVTCDSDGADIYVDDRLLGQTPLAAAIEGLPAGTHILRISKPGFADLHRFVDVKLKRTTTVAVSLESSTLAATLIEETFAAGAGYLYVASAVPGVEIRVDGEPKGETALAEPIKTGVGKRRLSLYYGEVSVVQEIEIQAERRTDVWVRLGAQGLVIADIEVVAAAAALPAPPAAITQSLAGPGRGSRWRFFAGVALGGLGALAAGVGLPWGAMQIKAAEEDAETERAALRAQVQDGALDGGEANARIEALNREGEALQRRQGIIAAVAGGLAAAGAGLLLWDWLSAPDEGPALRVEPLPGGASVGVVVAW